MTDYNKLVKALRCKRDDCEGCDLAFLDNDEGWMCQYAAKDDDAAAAIEELQAEVQSYKALADEWKASAENKERLLGLYRAEQRNAYSAMDDNGRIIVNPCACMNIPVFPDGSESPNS